MKSVRLILLAPCATCVLAQSPTTFRYFHDGADDLSSVLDPLGTLIRYTYDRSGNIIKISRSTAAPGSLTVLNFLPGSAPTGTTITIQGQGFSTTLSANIVTLNGVALAVVSATSTTLVVLVPANAITDTGRSHLPDRLNVGGAYFAVAGDQRKVQCEGRSGDHPIRQVRNIRARNLPRGFGYAQVQWGELETGSRSRRTCSTRSATAAGILPLSTR
jgi:YD repeat-containing protein